MSDLATSDWGVLVGAVALNLAILGAWWAIGSARTAAPTDLRGQRLAPGASRRFADAVGRVVARLGPRDRSRRRQRLDAAWWPGVGTPERWWGVRSLSAIGTGAVALGLAVAVGIGPVAVTAGVATVVGWLAPEAALARRVTRRRREVAAQLADLVDELAVMVRAGLGLDAAMVRAAQGARGALGEELSRVVQERRLGASRSEALSGFSTRMDLGDVNAVVAALAQAEELGVPVADALEVQSDALRVRRRQRAQEHAMTLPVRLLFPLVTCIFPALLVVLLGPAALSLIRGW